MTIWNRGRVISGESPLTDGRSILSSAALHVLLLAVLISVPIPRLASFEASTTLTLVGEVVDPAEPTPMVPTPTPGGAPGDLGGLGEIAVTVKGPGETANESALGRLLDEVLTTTGTDGRNPPTPPLPSTTGLGLLADDSVGGGGGFGGGSGGGRGRGVGPGTEFFGVKENAGSFAYVIDTSGSMARNRALNVAKAELLASLERLPPEARFGVVFYSLTPRFYERTLLPANPAEKAKFRNYLENVKPFGGTDHIAALRESLKLGAEVVYFLTDAELMTESEAEEVLRQVGSTRIHAIEFGVGPDLSTTNPLKNLTRATGGSHRYIDTNTFNRRSR